MASALIFPALRQRQRRQHRIGDQLDLPAHQVGQRRRRALVGDDQRVEPGFALEQFDRQMAGRAEARGREGVFLGSLRTRSNNSLRLLAGTFGGVLTSSGPAATSVIGVKSLTTS